MLAPIIKDKVIATAKVLQVFTLGKKGKVAGCKVISGNVSTKHRVRVKRNNEILSEGTIDSLKRFQDSVSEVREGQECGLRLSRNMDFQEGDEFEFYLREEIKQSL